MGRREPSMRIAGGKLVGEVKVRGAISHRIGKQLVNVEA